MSNTVYVTPGDIEAAKLAVRLAELEGRTPDPRIVPIAEAKPQPRQGSAA